VNATKSIDDPRRQGFKVVAVTKFDSLEDMKYYDEECMAHKKLKKFTFGKGGVPPLTVVSEV